MKTVFTRYSFIARVKKSLRYIGHQFFGVVHADCQNGLLNKNIKHDLQRVTNEIEQDHRDAYRKAYAKQSMLMSVFK
jgi:hypothetical protein